MAKPAVPKKGGHILRADPERQAEIIEACKADGCEVESGIPAA